MSKDKSKTIIINGNEFKEIDLLTESLFYCFSGDCDERYIPYILAKLEKLKEHDES